MKTFIQISFLCFFSLSYSIVAFANDPATEKESIFESFTGVEVKEITIQTNISSILDNIRNKEYTPATILFNTEAGLEQYSIKLRSRGKYRRRVCDFPPLKVKFSKKDLQKKGLAKYNKLKLVTHCNEAEIDAKSLLKEYQTYKLYNLLTDKSFRVQLLKINYIDVDGSKMKRYGFFIESEDELADRLDGEIYEGFNVSNDSLNYEDKHQVAVFQFMIGNSDWHVQRLKNVALIQPKDGGNLIPVPYDFDFAGLVDAPYAKPSLDYPISTVKERIFLGPDMSEAAMEVVRDKFIDGKPVFIESCESFDLLEKAVRKDMVRYLNSFYKIIDQREKWTSL